MEKTAMACAGAMVTPIHGKRGNADITVNGMPP